MLKSFCWRASSKDDSSYVCRPVCLAWLNGAQCLVPAHELFSACVLATPQPCYRQTFTENRQRLVVHKIRHRSDWAIEQPIERASDRASARCSDWVREGASDQGSEGSSDGVVKGGIERLSERSSEGAIECAIERSSDRVSHWCSDPAIERSSDRVNDRATQQPSDGATERPSGWGIARSKIAKTLFDKYFLTGKFWYTKPYHTRTVQYAKP